MTEFDDTSLDTHHDEGHSGDDVKITHLTGMYEDYFIDYASYVILERAVPNITDGLKPVQRRIMHAMKRIDDGRYNKVANVVGETMKLHTHGDASIFAALEALIRTTSSSRTRSRRCRPNRAARCASQTTP